MLVRPVLILGGTAEARELAGLLIERGFDPVTSVAGVTSDPIVPPGRIRRGGFGSALGMVRYVSGQAMIAIVDATHPFAETISRNAAHAAERAGLPLLQLDRPAWTPLPEDRWIAAADIEEAARLIPAGARALVTTGRKELSPFLARTDVTGVIRTIEPPATALPANWAFITGRPPYEIASERALIERERVTILVTKNAGGEATRAKLDAAREKKIPVIMVERPPRPEAPKFWPPLALANHLERTFMA
jgi:precorrin-6A/cobalt-precorrin-6A reductase